MNAVILLMFVVFSNAIDWTNVLLNLERDVRDIETTEAMIRRDIEYDQNLYGMYLSKYEQFQIKHEMNFYRRQLAQTIKVKQIKAKRFITMLDKAPEKCRKVFEKKFNLPQRIEKLRKLASEQPNNLLCEHY